MELGGDISAAAGPIGRTAEADVTPVAAVYAYSRSRDFSPVSLSRVPSLRQETRQTKILRTASHTGADPVWEGQSADGGQEASKDTGEILTLRSSMGMLSEVTSGESDSQIAEHWSL